MLETAGAPQFLLTAALFKPLCAELSSTFDHSIKQQNKALNINIIIEIIFTASNTALNKSTYTGTAVQFTTVQYLVFPLGGSTDIFTDIQCHK